MLVMMKHPQHGRLPVYSVSEVESNKAAGWVIDEDAEENKKPAPPVKAAPEPQAPPPPAPKPPRRGFFAPSDAAEV